MRYWNGELRLSVSDFGAGGYGFPWGQTRRYNNRLIQGAVNHGIGVNSLVDQQNDRCVVKQSDLLETWRLFFPEDADDVRLNDGLSMQLSRLENSNSCDDLKKVRHPGKRAGFLKRAYRWRR